MLMADHVNEGSLNRKAPARRKRRLSVKHLTYTEKSSPHYAQWEIFEVSPTYRRKEIKITKELLHLAEGLPLTGVTPPPKNLSGVLAPNTREHRTRGGTYLYEDGRQSFEGKDVPASHIIRRFIFCRDMS